MLICCSECKQVVEICTLREHLLDECDMREHFQPCPKCGDALQEREVAAHIASCTATRPSRNPKCALCHAEISDSKDGWAQHLLDEGCPANPRTR
jgi:centrosomal protein CEP104